ncbi:MAG: hypothetical protein ABL984_08280 [Pyrinomonadaceae bacterium]
MPRIARFLFTFSTAFMLAFTFACAPQASSPGRDSTAGDGSPELTEDTIRERINGVRVWDIPEENGASDPISWGFFEEEPKEIIVVEKQLDRTRATIVLDIKTSSTPRARDPRYLAGQIRTEWELRTGWVLRRWEIVGTENISMKYRNLPKPTPQPPSR